MCCAAGHHWTMHAPSNACSQRAALPLSGGYVKVNVEEIKLTLGAIRIHLLDRSDQTGGLRFQYTGPVWPVTGQNRSNSNLNSNFPVQPIRIGIPAGLAGNRSNSIFFLFLFKFKCQQNILNKYLYNIF